MAGVQTKPIKKEAKVQSTKANKDGILKQISETIEDCIKLSVETDRFGYHINRSLAKINVGAFSITTRIYLKQEPSNSKTLMFIVDKDKKRNLFHITIMGWDPVTPTILFTTSDEYPITKLERYVPSIMMTTQNMIK